MPAKAPGFVLVPFPEGPGQHVPGGILRGLGLVGKPGAKVGGKISPKGESRALPVLFVGSGEHQQRRIGVEVQLPNGNRSQFPTAKPGQYQGLVNEFPFPPEPFQPAAGFASKHGNRFALSLAPVNRHGVHQRPATCHVQELDQFGFRQRPALPAAVGLHVGLRHPGEGIGQQPACPDAPVAEAHQVLTVLVTVGGPHAFALASRKPSLQGGRGQVGKATKAAVGYQAVQVKLGNPYSFRAYVVCGLVVKVGGEVIGKRGFLVVDHRIFGGGENLPFHLFRPAFEVPEHRPGGRFVAASGCHFPDDPRAVPKLRG